GPTYRIRGEKPVTVILVDAEEKDAERHGREDYRSGERDCNDEDDVCNLNC
ncbi:hypothetical protein A2U01_0084894, partial [Trifolium medium]|nr:hypothetical protein [Trifolium medium]